jgi:hypothetical protein
LDCSLPHSSSFAGQFSTAFFLSRVKDNPIDRQLLEELIRTHSDRLRPFQPQSIAERKLDQYCRIAAVCYPQTVLLHWSRALGNQRGVSRRVSLLTYDSNMISREGCHDLIEFRRRAVTRCWDHAGLSHNETAALFFMPNGNSVAQVIRGERELTTRKLCPKDHLSHE